MCWLSSDRLGESALGLALRSRSQLEEDTTGRANRARVSVWASLGNSSPSRVCQQQSLWFERAVRGRSFGEYHERWGPVLGFIMSILWDFSP